MTGRIFGVDEALASGLIGEVLSPEALYHRARAIPLEIAENCSGVSVAMARQMLWRMLSADHPMTAHRIESRAMAQLAFGADAVEGVQAFLGKRSAAFPMRVSVDMHAVYPWFDEPPFAEDTP